MRAQQFEIVVRGRLSPTLEGALGGFELTTCKDGLTHLVGWVPDQARLHGVLQLLEDLNIELESVNPVPPQAPVQGQGHGDPAPPRDPG